jgi:acetylornithine deacetylase/succinyl-diaminopimelate desuccinylase-like protein
VYSDDRTKSIQELSMPDVQLSSALKYAREQNSKTIAEIKSFVEIPSISTDKNAKLEMMRGADWLASRLKDLRFHNVEILPTPGAPIVCGELLEAGPERPTVLIYGHYDVQPVEPLELWESMPFEPEVRGDHLFGRGTSDMKGQIVAVLAALNALEKTGGLPINVKFMVEGEEEIGSPNLDRFIIENKARLSSDFALNPDSGMIGQELPTITYGLRGMSYLEIRLTGPDHDLHSGMFGGAVHNPAQVLCELIAGMHDSQGRVTLPGFYEKVRKLEDDERAELARLPMTETFYLSQTGCRDLFGETGYSPVERVVARPTLEVNGLLSGFTGAGSKTVLPAKAMAKVSTRLVPDQDPFEVRQQLAQYLEENVPPTVHWELILHSTGYPSITDRGHPAVKAMKTALEETWGKRPLFKREGGSIPVVASMQKNLGIESVLTGFSLPEDNLHAPNERLHLPTFERGIQALIRFFTLL